MADINFAGEVGRWSKLFDWPVRLAALNLLWILGVLAGLVLVGLAPSTLALYTLLREYLLGRSPQPWRDFWSIWRSNLITAQLGLGLPILTIWVAVFYALTARGTPFALGVAVLAAAYIATALLLPAAFAYLGLSVTDTWKSAIVIAWRRPHWTIGVALLVIALLIAAWFLAPAAIPIFFPSLPALLATLVFHRGVATPEPPRNS